MNYLPGQEVVLETWPKRFANAFLSLVLLRWFNRMSWRWLVGSLILLTLVAAAVYFWLTQASTKNGIISSTPGEYFHWYDSLYFSIATETTVGYGDLAPHGWSRLVACIQAFAGLTIVGMMINKIATRPGLLLKQAVERCSGDWIELTYIKESDTLVVSLITIGYVEQFFRYDGSNFDQNGNDLGFFRGYLQDKTHLDRDRISFEYSNRHSETVFFDKGVTELKFSDLRLGQYYSFSGYAKDETMMIREFYGGYRANPEQSKQIHSKKIADQEILARQFGAMYSEATGHKWLTDAAVRTDKKSS